jgi:hypothetical protein
MAPNRRPELIHRAIAALALAKIIELLQSPEELMPAR